MKLKEIGALFALAALWGASFLFIRIASPEIGPLLTIEARVTIAGLALFLFILATKRSANFKQWWKQYLIIGALNAAIPFTLIAIAAIHLNASIMAIVNALTPICTALAVWIGMKEKLTVRKGLGMVIGLAGVVILVGWSPISPTKEVYIAIGCSILSTVSYGFAGVYIKKTFTKVSPLSLATGQQIGAAIVLLPITLLFSPPPTASFSLVVILSVVGLALFCTSVAYLFYFYLIDSVGPTKTLSVTFLVPIFGMIWGFVFLQEKITYGMMIGLLIILSSVLLISDISFGPKVKTAKTSPQ
ncbi:DMT family transporter [Neobacillus sp. LXY-4]|uniref:DMT family transporter n=1 Tax=Neobacillus sp. LXY-4 TaxID=3379826 RepID=UPI003EDF73B4